LFLRTPKERGPKPRSLSFLNLSSLKASSAYTYFSPLAINQSSYLLNIGAPYSTAYPVGMADLISKRRFFATYFTLGHACHPLSAPVVATGYNINNLESTRQGAIRLFIVEKSIKIKVCERGKEFFAKSLA